MNARQPHLGWTVAGGVLALAISQGIGRFAYTPLLPAMQTAGGFGPDVAGYIASTNYAGYLIGAFIVALLPKRWGLAVFRVSLIASLITTAAMALTTSVLGWAILRGVAGIASAGVLIIASDIVFRRLVRDKREALRGMPFAGVGAGIAISGIVVAATLQPFGWAMGWAALGALATFLAPVCWIGLNVRDPAPTASGPLSTTPLLRFSIPLLLGAYFFEGLGYIVSGTFLVAIVAGMPALSSFAPYTWIVVGLAACAAPPVWGAIAARTGPVVTLIVAHLVQAAGIAAPAFAHTLPVVLFSAITFGGTISSVSGLTLSLAPALSPDRSARLIGLLTAAFGIGQIIGPVVAGELAVRSGNFDTGLLLAAGAVAFGALLLIMGLAARRQTAAA